MTSRTFFSFKHASTGELLRVSDRDTHVELTNYAHDPVFEARTSEQLADILFENTPYYNTSRELPGWGNFKREDLVPVKATVRVELEELKMREPLRVRTLEVRDIPLRVANKYAGFDLQIPPKQGGPVFWLVTLPEGETIESVREKWGGEIVFGGDRYTKRRLHAVAPVPEEYLPLTKGMPAALFIASGPD